MLEQAEDALQAPLWGCEEKLGRLSALSRNMTVHFPAAEGMHCSMVAMKVITQNEFQPTNTQAIDRQNLRSYSATMRPDHWLHHYDWLMPCTINEFPCGTCHLRILAFHAILPESGMLLFE